jgi:hypothetical protein
VSVSHSTPKKPKHTPIGIFIAFSSHAMMDPNNIWLPDEADDFENQRLIL